MSERPEFVRESRRRIAAESPLNPVSLVGSYFTVDGDDGWQIGLVVGEPQPGVYLCEYLNTVTEESQGQRLATLRDMVDWTFYDSSLTAVRSAMKAAAS